MSTLHPKVKVPAIVGTVVTVALAVLAALTGIPALIPYVTAATTLLTTVSGYLTYS